MSEFTFCAHGIPLFERCRECEAHHQHAPESQEQQPITVSAQ
jgi:hypothetical protein